MNWEPSKDSDQSGLQPSHINIFAMRSVFNLVLIILFYLIFVGSDNTGYVRMFRLIRVLVSGPPSIVGL